MHIIVCIKQVPDPEGPPSSYVINNETLSVEPSGIPPLLSIFDENALEAALKLKDNDSSIKITILTMGKRISNAVLQKGLAVGADELVKIEDEVLDSANIDSYNAANILASAVKKIGEYDLILTGRQAADWNAGQTGTGIAEILNIPAVTLARKLEVSGNEITVERLIADGYEKVKTALPALVMVSNEIGQLRYPTIIQRREAKKKPVTSWDNDATGAGSPAENRVKLCRLFEPETRKGDCVIIEGGTPEEAGANLAARLKEDSVI